MGKYFGTDGFRGEANVKLTAEHAFKIGRYVGWYYGREHKARIVIGKDTRRSGYMLEAGLIAGITASGSDAYQMHVTTTPSVAYAVKAGHFDCGIMISASHNAYMDNGIKLINKEGRKIEPEVEARIEAYIDGITEELPLSTGSMIGCAFDYAAGRENYIQHLISIPVKEFDGLKIGLDCANGSASAIAGKVLGALHAQTYVINNQPNGTNINRDCGSTHLEALQEYVVRNNLDMGFAYDGDADRCLAVDADGSVVDGDGLMYICGLYLRQKGALKDDTVVTTVMSNLGLYKALEKEGMRYEQTAVGDKYVAENMLQNGYSLGGEQSGHIIFGDYASTGDGILTSLMAIEACVAQKKGLRELASGMQTYPQLLKNVRVADKRAIQEHPRVQQAIQMVGASLGSEGRILVRESGTEPLIRVMVEAATEELCSEHVNAVVEVIRSCSPDNQ